MKDARVKDIMVPLSEYPSISETQTLRQAIEQMGKQITRKKYATLPRVALVFDAKFKELLGVLRRRDIMRGLEPNFLVSGGLDHQRKLFDVAVDPNLSEISYDHLLSRIRERADGLVKDYMIPLGDTIDANDHILKAMSEMVSQNTSLLPVLKDDDVVGVIRSVDVLCELGLLLLP